MLVPKRRLQYVELEKWFESYAGISGSIANGALDLIGVEKDPEVKKY